MRIAVCDDDPEDIREFTRLLRDACPPGRELEIQEFTKGTELLSCMEREEAFAVIFLDILMPGMDGKDTAERIRKLDAEVLLIFLTSLETPSPELFRVIPFRYLVKNTETGKLDRELREIIAEAVKRRRYLLIPCGGRTMRLTISGIRYLTITGREVEIVSDQGVFRTRKKMESLDTELKGCGFGRCHKSFLVNLNHILAFDRKRVTLDSGEQLPISQPKAVRFKEEFLLFAGSDGR